MKSKSMGSWREWLLAACVLVFSDIIAAQVLKQFLPQWDTTVSERQYRIKSDIYHHDLARGTETIGVWGGARYPMRTNSLGFKDATTRDVPLKSERHRMLFIGDSFTEGIGLPYEKTYVGLIAEQLEPLGIEVLNAGVSSYSPAIYYSKVRYLLEDVGLEFAELVVFIDISDIANEAWLYDVDGNGRVSFNPEKAPREALTWSQNQQARGWAYRLKQFLKSNSVVVRALDVARDRLEGPGDRPLTGVPEALWTTDDRHFEEYGRIGLERAAGNMDRLADLTRQRDIGLTVAVYPWPDQVAHDSVTSRQVVYWRGWAEHAGARFVDLFEPFFRDPDREATIRSYYVPVDVHFNAAGNRLVADAFLDAYRRFDTVDAGR